MKKIKKVKKLFVICILLFGLSFLLLINPANNIQMREFDSLNAEQKDFSNKFPFSGDPLSENIIFAQLPNSELIDNTDIINDFYNYLEDDSIIYDRPASIIATYFIVSTLYSIDPDLLLTKADKILEYLDGLYNPDTEMFEDNINYTFYNERYGEGKQLLLAPYTPEITHEMALVVLKKCDRLSAFSGTQINNWINGINGIWSNQNLDGGFGTLHSPNSTLLETYYAVECLLALNDYNTDIFSAFQKNVIGTFIESRQRTSDWTSIGIGAFGEYSEDIFIGWEFFYASWLALNTIDMIGGDFSNVKDGFIDFVIDSNLNNPETHCFYAKWNDRASPDIITYYGTVILGDCIKLLNAEAQFPDLFDCQSTLISANIIEETGNDLDYNYFYPASNIPGDDLFSQYLTVNYLTNIGVWNLVDEQEFIDYYLSFLTENGGSSYISNIWGSAKGDFLKYSALKYSGINESQVFDLIMSRKFSKYFGDLENISTNPQDQSHKILQHWNEWAYYPIATNYFSIKLLEEYNFMDDFYNEIGVEYELFIEWIYENLTPEGYFCNSPEHMVSGNLESTYFALESQKILLEYDELHDFDDYYTIQEINSILSYCEQFIIENDDYWYVNCSGSLENKDMGKFQSILYVLSIEEILGGNAIDYGKLENFLIDEYENQWGSLNIQEKTNLLNLLNKMECTFTDLNTKISHIQIANQIQYIITQDHYPEDEVNFIGQLLKDSDVIVYMDISSNQILGESYTYLAQFSSVASLILVENLNISGYSTNFSNWYSLGSMIACEAMPDFSEITPYSWDVSINFNYRGDYYCYPFSVNLSIPFSSTVEIDSDDLNVTAILSVNCPDSLAFVLEPELLVYDFESDLIGNYQTSNMSKKQGADTTEFECKILEDLSYGTNYTIIWDFNMDFLDNVSLEFKLTRNYPPILFNENITNAGNQITQKNLYQYNFTITYSDPESNPSEYVKLIINKISYLMDYQNGDYQSGAKFGCNIYLEAGNYTYYFLTCDGKNTIIYPEIDLFYLNVTDLSKEVPKIRSGIIGNYIIESIISLGSVGAGVSGFIFKNKQKFYKDILSKIISNPT